MIVSMCWTIIPLVIVHVIASSCVELPQRAARLTRNVGYKYGYKYGVVIDAGSSGTRVNVYQWDPRKSNREVVDIRHINSTNIKPGLSDYAPNRDKIKADITKLVNFAKAIVPVDQHIWSPIYVMATAGLRLVKDANEVIDFIDNDIMLNTDINPFEYETRNTRILSGEEEGVFAWIAVNYLLGVFKQEIPKSNGKHSQLTTYGILELGGASTQIAFHPKGSILSDKFPVKIASMRIPIYVHSYLIYGQNYVDQWIREQLTSKSFSTNITNPCTPTGDVQVHSDRTFYGGGKPEDCIELLGRHVYKDPDRCFPKPCGIGQVYQAPIPANQTFYAVGAFVYSLKAIGALADDGQFKPGRGLEAAIEYCSKPIDPTRRMDSREAKFAAINCVAGLYISVLFTKGYGFPNDTDKIYAVENIHGQPAAWSLGAIIYEMELKGWDCSLELSVAGSIHRQWTLTYWIGLSLLTALPTQTVSRIVQSRLM